jgi:hypothetical protein
MVRCKNNAEDPSPAELGERDEEETTARLEQLLASRLVVGRDTIRLRRGPSKGPIRLQAARLIVDSNRAQRLRVEKSLKVPVGAESVVVQGNFRIVSPVRPWWQRPTRQSVQFEVPSLLQEIEPRVFYPGADELRRMLERPFDAEAVTRMPIGEADGSSVEGIGKDVRFPWAEWIRFESTCSSGQREAWLSQVIRAGRVPDFWKQTARALLGI